MNNYQTLCFLRRDGGHYDAHEQLELLQRKFPKAGFTEKRVKNLRNVMSRSKFVKVNVIREKGVMKVQVVYVSSKFAKYSHDVVAPEKERDTPKWTLFAGEPTETVVAIRQRQMFDQLLSECRGAQR